MTRRIVFVAKIGGIGDAGAKFMALRRSAVKQAGVASVVQVRLTPGPRDAELLAEALAVCNGAATYASRIAWTQRTFGQLALHRLAYRELRVQFPRLGAQAAIRAITRVAGAYANRRASKKRTHIFRPHGAVPYDARMISFNRDARIASVTSDREVLPGRRLSGTIKSNGHVRGLRERRYRQRRRLQKKGTSSARRRLRALSGCETRMMTDVSHQISRHVVREAERTGRGIAMEDLAGIRGRVRAHRSQRRTLHNWAFAQQVVFFSHKAERVGIAFVTVDAAFTSQTCPGCGHVSKRNRPARGQFRCRACGLAGHADHIAAINIAQRGADGWGAVNRPHATGLLSSRWAPESKPRASVRGR